VPGEHDDAETGMALAQGRGGLEAVHPWHRQVHDDHAGLLFLDRLKGGEPVAGLTDHAVGCKA
jgi:hypothetical protein